MMLASGRREEIRLPRARACGPARAPRNAAEVVDDAPLRFLELARYAEGNPDEIVRHGIRRLVVLLSNVST